MKRTSRRCAPPLQVRNAQRARIDLAHARLDLLIGQQRVVNALALEVAIAHHLGAAEHLGIEREGAIHVLHCEAEMLHALQPRAERPLFRAAALAGRASAASVVRDRRQARPPTTASPAAWMRLRRWKSVSSVV